MKNSLFDKILAFVQIAWSIGSLIFVMNLFFSDENLPTESSFLVLVAFLSLLLPSITMSIAAVLTLLNKDISRLRVLYIATITFFAVQLAITPLGAPLPCIGATLAFMSLPQKKD